ncbi:hypothetical protein A2154_01690 [Candidatus Gottesmanbacteria bacterium RBG_16_43_7]|uniref:Uncharacterized protein n=1 Tax=Candidatus Gottesmanbacteria bacterium RBG_16_43_7 TaxID=1798373 RepID=A0A1F5Z8P1_9BACT|nr:MAG: hypothetical protein A2154_01690 [Candidatus Gottesmanbacteria bacterium RBG_16_43_7]
MDIIIVTAGLAGFALFLILQLLTFRLIDSRILMAALMRIFISASIILTVSVYVISVNFIQSRVLDTISHILLALLIYGALCFIYVTAVFGITVTSVRIQILRLIYNAGDKGLPYINIYKKYNKQVIIKTRLERLVGSGELICRDNKYYLPPVTTFFMLHTKILVVLYGVFGNRGYQQTRY